MKRLYVGCRVRIVGCKNGILAHHVGKTGFIVAACRRFPGSWVVDCAAKSATGGDCSWHPSHLEPIQDPGHEVISWEEMRGLWTPSEVTA